MSDIDQRYENGKIYCLSSNNSDLFYIGSTIQPLAKRLQYHEYHYRAYQKGKGDYYSSYDVLATGDYSISLYNEYPCNSKSELDLEEGYEIEHNLQYAGCVNRSIPGMGARFGGRKQYKKQWQAQNWKNTEIIQCGCGGTYHDCTYQRKKHFHSNKHKYWEEHGQVKPKGNDLIRCECDGRYIFQNRANHFKTRIHQKYLASK